MKSPSLYTYQIPLKELTTILDNVIEIKDNDVIKPNINNCNKIITYNLDMHKKTCDVLKNNNVKYYTYTPKRLKNKNIVLKISMVHLQKNKLKAKLFLKK